MAQVAMEKAPVSFGVALLEDANKKLSHVEVIDTRSIASREPELLAMANAVISLGPGGITITANN